MALVGRMPHPPVAGTANTDVPLAWTNPAVWASVCTALAVTRPRKRLKIFPFSQVGISAVASSAMVFRKRDSQKNWAKQSNYTVK